LWLSLCLEDVCTSLLRRAEKSVIKRGQAGSGSQGEFQVGRVVYGEPPHFRIISEALAFNNAFKALHATQLPQPKLPAVDFATTAVLVVALGQQPSTGYRVEVERIERQGEMLNVNLQLTTPSPDAARATVMTSPYIVIEVSKQPSWKIVKFFDQEQKLLAELDASK
jgi:hypothetical protein